MAVSKRPVDKRALSNNRGQVYSCPLYIKVKKFVNRPLWGSPKYEETKPFLPAALVKNPGNQGGGLCPGDIFPRVEAAFLISLQHSQSCCS